MHIKIVNTQGEYKCIIMGSDDPGRIYRRKGYKAIDRLKRRATLWVLMVFILTLTEAVRSIFRL